MSQSRIKKLRQVLRGTGVAISDAKYHFTPKSFHHNEKAGVEQPEVNKDGTTRFKTMRVTTVVHVMQDASLVDNCGRKIYQNAKKRMNADPKWLDKFIATTALAQAKTQAA